MSDNTGSAYCRSCGQVHEKVGKVQKANPFKGRLSEAFVRECSNCGSEIRTPTLKAREKAGLSFSFPSVKRTIMLVGAGMVLNEFYGEQVMKGFRALMSFMLPFAQ